MSFCILGWSVCFSNIAAMLWGQPFWKCHDISTQFEELTMTTCMCSLSNCPFGFFGFHGFKKPNVENFSVHMLICCHSWCLNGILLCASEENPSHFNSSRLCCDNLSNNIWPSHSFACCCLIPNVQDHWFLSLSSNGLATLPAAQPFFSIQELNEIWNHSDLSWQAWLLLLIHFVSLNKRFQI